MDAAAGGLGDDAELAALRLVCRKRLDMSDFDRNQMRLLITCKGDDDGDARALTADEKDRVRADYFSCDKWIQVPAYDRHGWRFDVRLKKTEANRGYRFFGTEWGRFLRDNQLAEAMAAAKKIRRKLEAELCAFRSTELLPEPRAEADHHPDGALGVAILIR